jgi:hypothetical protein
MHTVEPFLEFRIKKKRKKIDEILGHQLQQVMEQGEPFKEVVEET